MLNKLRLIFNAVKLKPEEKVFKEEEAPEDPPTQSQSSREQVESLFSMGLSLLY